MRRHVAAVWYWLMRPVFDWRGRIISRSFCEERPRFYDAKARDLIERASDAFEMWQMKPDFERMEAVADECERIAEELAELRCRFGLEKSGQAPSAAPKGDE